MTNWRALTTWTTTCALLAGIGMWSPFARAEGVKRIPLSVPFAATTINQTQVDFTVDDKRLYAVALNFAFREGDQADRARVWKLTGGKEPAPTAAPLRVRLQVQKIALEPARPLLDTELKVEEIKVSSYGATQLTKELTALELEPGRYRLVLQTLQPAPEFAGTKTNLAITIAYRGK